MINDYALTIERIGVHRPPGVPIDEAMRVELGMSRFDYKLFRRMFGFDQVARDPAATESELLLRAVRDIPDLDEWLPHVTTVIRARTMRDPSPYPHNALIDVLRGLGLDTSRVNAFSMSDHACATGIRALEVADDLLRNEADPEARVLLLAGEKCYGKVGRLMQNMAILGEATAAVVLRRGGEGPRVLNHQVETEPQALSDLVLDEATLTEFADMLGSSLERVAHDVIAKTGLVASDIDAYVASIVNRWATLTMAEKFGIARDKVVLSNVADLGHCFSADVFINLASGLQEGILEPGDIALLTSVGVGSSYGAALVQV